MDGVLKRIFRQSFPNDECVIELYHYCKFSPELIKVPVIAKPLCKNENCHRNVNHYVRTYGGKKISGYYLITDVNNSNYGCAIYHSVWENTYGNIIDITPFDDNREYNIFSIMDSNDYYSGIVYDGNNFKLM